MTQMLWGAGRVISLPELLLRNACAVQGPNQHIPVQVVPGAYISAGRQGSLRKGEVQAPRNLPSNPETLQSSAYRCCLGCRVKNKVVWLLCGQGLAQKHQLQLHPRAVGIKA